MEQNQTKRAPKPVLIFSGIVAAVALAVSLSYGVVTSGLQGVTGRYLNVQKANWATGGVDAVFVESMLYRDAQLRTIANSALKQAVKPRVRNFSTDLLKQLDTWDQRLNSFKQIHSIANSKANQGGYGVSKAWANLSSKLNKPALTDFDRQFVAGINIVSHSSISVLQQNVSLLVDPQLKAFGTEMLNASAQYGPQLSGWMTATK